MRPPPSGRAQTRAPPAPPRVSTANPPSPPATAALARWPAGSGGRTVRAAAVPARSCSRTAPPRSTQATTEPSTGTASAQPHRTVRRVPSTAFSARIAPSSVAANAYRPSAVNRAGPATAPAARWVTRSPPTTASSPPVAYA
ncbi:hypothetical protein [Spirilliplanes yamanashiensis]|uniref:hypothetical protein n=1 Tax=Spirilliplanes yamanashiensis TaxID=42233 RepID=UPI0019519E2B|nr:hypothetical protein [Spirilliplanes yamanashiensis]MDP9814826.1 hypothetical protein [Spirilliplanes yamanashiensis]